MTLNDLLLGQVARVVNVNVMAARALTSGEPDDTPARLEEIGFTRGEPVAVLTRGVPGGDPLVVRVGQSRFALRRAEAQCVEVVLK